MLPFDQQYQQLIKNLLDHGIEDLNQRTGHHTKSLPGQTIQVDLAESFPVLTLRKIPLKIFIAEQIWFIMGSRRPDEFLSQYTHIWDDFTNLNGVVTTSYGYRMRHHFGRDQLASLIKLLETDPSSRHGVVVFWDPADDGLGARGKKNVPCPYTFTVNIIRDRLHFHLIVRSNDMLLGCPHDHSGFALLAYILAAHLKVQPGIFTHSISNAHIYDIHYPAAEQIATRQNQHPPIKLNLEANAYSRAESGDHQLVTELLNQLKSQYQPLPAIKNLNIVL